LNRTLSKSGITRGKRLWAARQRQFQVSVAGSTGRAHFAYLRRQLLAAEQFIPLAPRCLSLALVGDATMSRLHRQFLNIPGPTDVLTFELDHDIKGRAITGEVIVCLPQARRHAQKNGSTVQKELLLYALHGMLHLSGFDDRTASGYRAMHRMEDQILTRLGVGPVFSGGPHRREAKLKDR
jgi:probable rRNA maturation factor